MTDLLVFRAAAAAAIHFDLRVRQLKKPAMILIKLSTQTYFG